MVCFSARGTSCTLCGEHHELIDSFAVRHFPAIVLEKKTKTDQTRAAINVCLKGSLKLRLKTVKVDIYIVYVPKVAQC